LNIPQKVLYDVLAMLGLTRP